MYNIRKWQAPFTFNITNSRLEDWVDKQVILLWLANNNHAMNSFV